MIGAVEILDWRIECKGRRRSGKRVRKMNGKGKRLVWGELERLKEEGLGRGERVGIEDRGGV